MNKKIIFSVVVSVVLIYFLMSMISLEDLRDSVLKLSLPYVLLALGFYLLSYIFRSLRFLVFLKNDMSFRDIFPIVCIHNVMNYLIPARLGELSYFYLLKRKKIEFGKSVASFAVVRFFDLLVVSIIFFVSLIFMKNVPESFNGIVPIVAVLVGLLLIFILISPLLYRYFSSKLNSKRLFVKKLKEIYDALLVIKSKSVLFSLFLFSVLIWFSLYSLMYVLLLDLGIQFSLWQAIIVISFPLIISALPINGIGGYGTTEVAWLIPFLAFGLSKEIAIANGFVIHTFQFALVLLFGLVGYLLYKFKK
ncbi:flippase-like domain-containing protein [archaeon]|nr:flippase-like domain-containing protein [archaeon]